MKEKYIKKILAIFIVISILLSNILNIIYATNEVAGEKLIKNKGDCGYHLQYWNNDRGQWSYIKCFYVVYEQNGKEYPAYCLDQQAHGVGDVEEYNVDVTKILEDVRIWRTIKNGYPYKTPSELGVDNENNLVDTLITNKEGIAISKEVLKGKYTIKEIKAPDYYMLNENRFETEITKNKEVKNIEVVDENVNLDVNVIKTGFIETQCEDTIYYVFKDIKNNSNVPLDNFIWQDSIPTDAVRLEKAYTGTWNEDLKYSVWYKTNISDEYKMFIENLSTNIDNELDFTTLNLSNNEYVTDFEFHFGSVRVGFQELEKPVVYCKVLNGLENGYIFTNKTKVSGTYLEEKVEDNDEWSTVIYKKSINLISILPKTGI